jgi:hypothetical protein
MNPDSIAAAIRRIADDAALRSRLIAAGGERLRAFTVQRQIDGHLAAFATAIRRHTPLRAWFNERVRLPRSEQMRTTLSAREAQIAAGLLRRQARLPRSYEAVTA